MESRVEGQSLVIQCPYNAQQYSEMGKTWCQLREKSCFLLVSTSYTSPGRYKNKVTAGRATIQDDTSKGTVTITMEKLEVQDSGVYWCAVLGSSNTVQQLKAITLDVYKVQEYNALEGQSLSVQCPYNTELYKKAQKAWCQRTAQSTCADLVSIDDGLVTYHNRAQNGKAMIYDNTQTGTVTVTMEKLQTDDAGVYWCTLYEPPNLYLLIEVKLTVTKGLARTLFPSTEYTTPVLHSNSTNFSYSQESQNINSLDLRSAFLWLGVSALINKVLIAVIMGLLVRRRNHRGEGAQTPGPRGS
nr:triggering receptor expressed on myeloid cells 1-like [Pelodiscus sinensis]|eukprot:XP_025038516.1 triggering receptor expressed on myeloid cells 1-like [Pelodiscus sinensis]